MKKVTLVFLAVLFVLGTLVINAQDSRTTVTVPTASQKAMVMQRVGITDITITYSSPAVKGREIYGKLVPFDKLWRAGADENTTIHFTHDVVVEGQKLAKGTYGLFMVPGQTEWEVVFSKNYTSWGHYFYKQEEDVLRVKVKPEEAPFREYLSYDFSVRKDDSAVVCLLWEKLRVPFKIDVDTKSIVVANLRNEMRTLPWWYWQGTHGAAQYCLDNDVNLDEALKWVDQSISVEENFQNVILKSQLLEKLGKGDDAAKVKAQAMKIGTENDLTQYAYSFALKGDKDKCVGMLEANTKRFKSWTSYRAMARYYNYFKDKVNANKYFQLALKKVPADKKDALQKEIDKANQK